MTATTGPTAGTTRTGRAIPARHQTRPSRSIRKPRVSGQHDRPLVDVLAPAYLVLYILLSFNVFLLLIPIPQNAPILLVLFGMGVLLLTPRDRLGHLPIVWSAMAFIGWNMASRAWSEIPIATNDLILVQLVPLLVTALVVGTIPLKVAIRTLLAVMVAVAAWTLLISLVLPTARAAVFSSGPDGNQPGFRGTFGHKNDMGVFAVYALCIVLPFFRTAARRWVILLCVGLVISTRSATAASGLMTVAFAWFWIAAIDNQKSPRERQFLGVVSVTSAFAGILLTIGAMPALLGLYQKDLTFSGRTLIWAETLVSWRRKPIQGYGYGGVWWDGRSPVTMDLQQRIGFGAAHAHNGVIEVLVTVGLVGLALLLFFLYRLVRLSTWSFGQQTVTRYGQWGLLTIPAIVLMSVSEPLFRVPSLGLLVIMAVILTNVKNQHTTRARTVTRRRTRF